MSKERIRLKEPLFHISKRTNVSLKTQILVRVIAVLAGLLFSSLICLIVYGKSPIDFIWCILEGNFKPLSRVWELLQGTALLLGVSLALIPAFKMKFWNLGGNGQVLIGSLITIIFMTNLGGKLPDIVVWLIMFAGAVLGGAVWAVIPAIFKAFFKTNESLFSLMMNYIAIGFISFYIKLDPKTTGSTGVITTGQLPEIIHKAFLPVVLISIIALIVIIYMKHSKQGYEISIVGDSENTARYVGINVKKVIIRTLAISGAICGFIGFLISGAISYSLSVADVQVFNLGFTAIIAVWIANMNPVATIGSSFGIMFLTYGLDRVKGEFGITNDAVSNMIIGIMFLFIISCVFFINYSVKINKKSKKNKIKE